MSCCISNSVTGCYTEHRPFGEPTKGSLCKATPNRNKLTNRTNRIIVLCCMPRHVVKCCVMYCRTPPLTLVHDACFDMLCCVLCVAVGP